MQAVEQQRSLPQPPLVWESPYVLEIHFFNTADTDARAAQPGAERVDPQTVRFHGNSMIDIIYR